MHSLRLLDLRRINRVEGLFCFSKRTAQTNLTEIFNRIQSIPILSSASVFSSKKTGLFQIPELIDPSGFKLLEQQALTDSNRLVREATSSVRNRKLVQVFDELSNSLCRVADLCEFVKNGHPQPDFAIPAEETSAVVSAEVERLNTNRSLYDSLREVVRKGDRLPTDAIDEHVLRLFLFDMEQSGIHLNEANRQRIVQLNEQIFFYGQRFVQSTIQPVLVRHSHLPAQVRPHFDRASGEQVEVTGLHAHSDSELVREVAFKVYLTPNERQQKNLTALLEARKTLANLCGFKSYAERVLKGSIADSPEVVWNFLNILSVKIRELADKDYEHMLVLKRQQLGAGNDKNVRLRPWDVQHFAALQRARQQSSALTAALPYFSIGSCFSGLNVLCQKLYGVELRFVETEAGELWSTDVVKIGVFEDDRLLGFIYCDLFDRPGKPQQDCHFTIQGSCERSDGSYQHSIVVLFLSLPSSGRQNEPCLLSAPMVDNLFHEMGHAIHSMLARTRYQHVSGTRCSTDLAEVPSILMEYFASDERVVRQFARHYRNDTPIPDDLLQAWLNSKRVFVASETQLQVFYSVLDQLYHGENPLQQDTLSVLKDTQNSYYGIKYVEGTAWHLRFGHLYGYGGKYYSYLMSRAIARLIWDKLFATDPFSSIAGAEFRHRLLAEGGGVPPKKLVENVLHTQVNPKLLADAILKDIM